MYNMNQIEHPSHQGLKTHQGTRTRQHNTSVNKVELDNSMQYGDEGSVLNQTFNDSFML